jgi:hypothetical protein
MLPINIDDAGMKMLADAFGSTMGTFTWVFLLAPLGTTRQDSGSHRFGDQSGKKLTASSTLLAYGGRLQLITSCLAFMSISSCAP